MTEDPRTVQPRKPGSIIRVMALGALIGAGLSLWRTDLSVFDTKKTIVGQEAGPGSSGGVVSADALNYQSRVNGLIEKSRGDGLSSTEQLYLQATVDAWLDNDLEGCVNFLHHAEALSLVSRQALRRAASRLAKESFRSAFRTVAKITDATLRDEMLVLIFTEAGSADPKEAAQSVAFLPEHVKLEAIKGLVRNWVTRDGEAAIASIVSARAASPFLIKEAIVEYAQRDFKSAVALICADPNIPEHDHSRFSVDRAALLKDVFGKANVPPEAKLKAIEIIAPGMLRDALALEVITRWALQRPSDFSRIIESISDPSLRSLAVTQASKALNPHAAPDSVLASIEALPSERTRSAAAGIAAIRYAGKAPEAGVKWAQRLSDPLAKSAAVREAMGVWFMKSSGDALEYAAKSIQENGDLTVGNAVVDLVGELLAAGKTGSSTIDLSGLNKMSPGAKSTLLEYIQRRLPDALHAQAVELLK